MRPDDEVRLVSSRVLESLKLLLAGWSLVIAYGSMFALMLWREHRVFPVPYPWGRIARIPVVLISAKFTATPKVLLKP